jgi:hypothetical protein
MSWTETVEEFVGKHGFGARGKHISLSRILNPSDLAQLQTSQFVSSYRPRGILSGFLVIHPQLQYAVYLPPAASKLQPQRFHVRVDPRHMEHGVIASAYLYNKQLVIEDLVAIDGVTMWLSRGFGDRWVRLKQFIEKELRHDVFLQGGTVITSTSYMSLGSLAEPPDDKVVEFIPCLGGGQKRVIWIPDRAAAGKTEPAIGISSSGGGKILIAKRDASMGPDVYSLYDGETKLGAALVRTLVASRALRLAFAAGSSVDNVRVSVQFVKQFDKWEVLEVVAP